MATNTTPKTLQEAVIYFGNPENCLREMVHFRWPDGVVKCPTCGSEKVSFIKSRRLWECAEKHPKRQFSAKVGTIFESSHIKLHIWLQAMFLLCSSKKGISANQLHRTLGVTLKTAWFLAHRIREAMKDDGSSGPMGGEGKIIEADETLLGPGMA